MRVAISRARSSPSTAAQRSSERRPLSFIDPRNLAFLLYDWLGADRLPERPRFAEHSRETFDAVLELSAQLAADEFASHSKKSDREEPQLVEGQVRVIPE